MPSSSHRDSEEEFQKRLRDHHRANIYACNGEWYLTKNQAKRIRKRRKR